ncbi:MAG TPA: class I SAM-dependent methyltransferase [Gemmatimonadaceae bacterium]
MVLKFADNSKPDSLATRLRQRRFGFFLSLLRSLPRPLAILDVGGTQEFWERMGRDALGDVRVTLLNIQKLATSGAMFEGVQGDARDLSRYGDATFDVVFSNSVIEHLGPSFEDQRRMADEIRRVGRRYFVQTPNRYFPVEPHFLMPAFQFWPVSARVWAATHFGLGWYSRFEDAAAATREVKSICLLSESQVRELFPDASIYKEKFLGLTKSFVAYAGWRS